MVEKNYPFTLTNKKCIERILADDNVAINHMVLPKGKGCRSTTQIPMSI